MSYIAIAREEAAIVERTGLLGQGSAWAGQRVIARFFIDGFGTEAQRTAWLPHIAAVAISEPRVGAHPKLLTTRAEEGADGYRIFGEKAWVTNGPIAQVFVVLAVMAVEEGRKRYGAFLVPRDTPGLSLDEAPQYRALAPSRHCGVKLDGCHVPHAALLGAPHSAYETMALPFRDVEDAVGTFGHLGIFRFLLARFASCAEGDAATLSLGSLASLVAVFAEAAENVVAALDAGALADKAVASSGLRALSTELLQRARAHRDAFGPADDAAVDRAFADIETSQSVARGPRQARLVRLGAELIAHQATLRDTIS